MRGSVYYQTAQLTKVIFIEGVKKEERTDPTHPYYKCVAAYKTMETYRNVWNNLGNYLKEHWKLKDFERITSEHIEAYFEYKIEYYPSKQYVEKLSSALGKLEIALTRFSQQKYDVGKAYDFQVRQNVLNSARKLHKVADGYHNRVYQYPDLIIGNLKEQNHKIAASIQYHGGARSEAVTFIKKEQLKGYQTDNITNEEVGIIFTKEKGRKEGNIFIDIKTYQWLEKYFQSSKHSQLNYQAYANDIQER